MVKTSNDYFHAAMIFQHGDTTEDYKLAFSLAQLAITLDPSNKSALWLTAAAWDRILMSKKVPQWYGTQYYQPTLDGPFVLYEVNESVVTDEERRQLQVPSLLRLYNRLSPLAGLAVALTFYTLQVGFSQWWLARFQYGPMEWVWRCITYWKVQPFRLSQNQPPKVTGSACESA